MTSNNSVSKQVAIVMGSTSDHEVMQHARAMLRDFDVDCEYRVASAHRCPEVVAEFSQTARERGIKVIIAGAGMAAHLAGAVAANTTLPVIGVPLDAGSLKGMDALLATVQMPAGIPVSTVSIGKAGAKNAAILAVEILSTSNQELAEKLAQFRATQKKKVLDAQLPD